MAKKSIKKNYIYNLSYQILLLITPLITTPYLSRVLRADGIGTVSYAESIVSYFVLFATLGLTTFGQREISYVQDNMKKRTQVFWETKSLEIITAGIVLITYIPFAFYQQNKIVYLFLTFNLLAVLVDVTWFFQGLEEFGKIVLRNFIFKLFNIVYIFTIVITKDDLIWYTFGIAFFLFLSNVSLWLYLPKYIEKPNWKEIRPFRNIKTVVALFVPTIAIQMYTVLDKTMIGMITKDVFENGYYEQALKISKMTLMIVTALGTVMIPRIGYHFSRSEIDKVTFYMYRSYRFVWMLGIPLCFGLFGISSNFVPWFFGKGFGKVVLLINVLAFLILAIGINNVTGIQYLIPTKRETIFTRTVIIGAIVNFGLNAILIYYYQSIGAAIASVVAESVIAMVQLFIIRKELSAKIIVLSSWHYLIAGFTMLILLKWLASIFTPTIIHTLIMVVAGTITYGIILLLMKDEFLISNIRNIFGKFFRLYN